jgi:hypothetical protein
MSQINDLLNESQAQFSAQRNATKGLVSKWEATGLLEGVTAEYDKHNTAILLENQAKQLISEANATGTGANAEDWNGVALPLVRRIFGELSAKEFVSVQPMNLPSGLVFWMDFKYGTAKGRHAEDSSLFAGSGSAAADVTKGVYGYGGEGYSLNATATLVTASSGTASAAALADFDADLGMAAYIVDEDGVTHTPIAVEADGDMLFSTALSGSLYWYTNTADATKRGDFEDTTQAEITATGAAGEDIGIPEIEVQLENEALVAKTRKLKVKWSPEFAQDLNAYHSIDAEAELTSMLSEYITMEIDMEILQMLKGAAAFTSTHTFATLSGGMTHQDQYATIGASLQAMSNTIHQSTMRGGANFVVCSPAMATYLESIPGYGVDTDGTAKQFAMGVTAVGSLKNRFTIYKNPYWTGKELLCGYRGNQFLETGAVFAPYIPLIMTPLVYDPTNFTPRKGVMTRYAKKVVRKDYFGVITVDDTAITFGKASQITTDLTGN